MAFLTPPSEARAQSASTRRPDAAAETSIPWTRISIRTASERPRILRGPVRQSDGVGVIFRKLRATDLKTQRGKNPYWGLSVARPRCAREALLSARTDEV